MREEVFHFKRFDIHQTGCSVKVGTDGVLLGAWLRLRDAGSALDIGAGTGVITIMLAQRSSELNRICGVEIDKSAWETAVSNAVCSAWADRIRMHHGSVQEFSMEEKESYDLIVSNPPFFNRGTLSRVPSRNRIRHALSLPYEDLLESAEKLLSPEGYFNIILPGPEGLRFIEMAGTFGLFLTRKTEVFSVREKPVERLLLEFSRYAVSETEEEVLVIHRSKDREFTRVYRNLTRDFYLKF